MKQRFIYFALLFLCLFTLFACTKEEKTCNIYCDDLAIEIGGVMDIPVSSDADSPKYQYIMTGDNISINNGKITALKKGETDVIITVEGYTGSKMIKVITDEMGIRIKGESTVIINEEINLSLLKFGVDEDEKVVWKSSEKDIARVVKGVVTGIDFGTSTITATSGGFTDTFEVTVIRPMIESIDCANDMSLENGATYEYVFDVTPAYASKEVNVEISNDCLVLNSDNTITASKLGTCVLKLTSKVNPSVTKEINVHVIENKAPEFKQTSDYVETLSYNYGDDVDILEGISVIDNADGDITSKIFYDSERLLAYGVHAVTLEVTDKAGNTATFDRMVNVSWPYHTKFIGHSGCGYYTANTEQAFLYAAQTLHYQALECDLHSTRDGVFVTNHDSYITVDGKKIVIAETNYEDLIKYNISSSTEFACVCKFERYLEICKEYGCEAIVELKWSTGIVPSDQSNMPNLVNMVKSKGMWDNTVFLTSMQACLTWFRTNNYNDVRLQYLVSGGDNQQYLDYCIKYNIDISVNVTYGDSISDEWIKKYHDAGLEISTWTFSGELSQIQEWIDKGVEYVTCDYAVMEKLELK